MSVAPVAVGLLQRPSDLPHAPWQIEFDIQ